MRLTLCLTKYKYLVCARPNDIWIEQLRKNPRRRVVSLFLQNPRGRTQDDSRLCRSSTWLRMSCSLSFWRSFPRILKQKRDCAQSRQTLAPQKDERALLYMSLFRFSFRWAKGYWRLRGVFLKGHSQLCDRADLDTSFCQFEKRLPQPEIKGTRRIHPEIRFNLPSVLLDFQSFIENLFLSMLLLILWYYFIIFG